ncbi:MAG: Uncharacterized MFS-type transporter, partial [uncultured Rubrobacteraceae bacterium]
EGGWGGFRGGRFGVARARRGRSWGFPVHPEHNHRQRRPAEHRSRPPGRDRRRAARGARLPSGAWDAAPGVRAAGGRLRVPAGVRGGARRLRRCELVVRALGRRVDARRLQGRAGGGLRDGAGHRACASRAGVSGRGAGQGAGAVRDQHSPRHHRGADARGAVDRVVVVVVDLLRQRAPVPSGGRVVPQGAAGGGAGRGARVRRGRGGPALRGHRSAPSGRSRRGAVGMDEPDGARAGRRLPRPRGGVRRGRAAGTPAHPRYGPAPHPGGVGGERERARRVRGPVYGHLPRPLLPAGRSRLLGHPDRALPHPAAARHPHRRAVRGGALRPRRPPRSHRLRDGVHLRRPRPPHRHRRLDGRLRARLAAGRRGGRARAVHRGEPEPRPRRGAARQARHDLRDAGAGPEHRAGVRGGPGGRRRRGEASLPHAGARGDAAGEPRRAGGVRAGDPRRLLRGGRGLRPRHPGQPVVGGGGSRDRRSGERPRGTGGRHENRENGGAV